MVFRNGWRLLFRMSEKRNFLICILTLQWFVLESRKSSFHFSEIVEISPDQRGTQRGTRVAGFFWPNVPKPKASMCV
jgi:hypothetical protein